jgi:microcompartment protein CcmK/EutM
VHFGKTQKLVIGKKEYNMQRALIIGTTHASIKHPSIKGAKMLIVQPQMADGTADGDPLIAIDGVGAGVGETVMISSDGPYGRKLLNSPINPVRWTIIGIED